MVSLPGGPFPEVGRVAVCNAEDGENEALRICQLYAPRTWMEEKHVI